MKTVILAGGLGLRLSELTQRCPKPMVRIGPYPMLRHIMGIYSQHGFREFVIAMGYKQEVIRNYFERWECEAQVDLVDTGLETMTGGRLKRLQSWIGGETFMMTYGDGLANVDVAALVDFHKSHGRLATITAVHPPARFGCLHLEGNRVMRFDEKPQASEGWINGGFFVLEPEVLDFIDGDEVSWERAPLEALANQGELMAFYHDGFWQPMDNLREQKMLEEMWVRQEAPWIYASLARR